MVHSTTTIVREVHPAHVLNGQALLKYMQETIPGCAQYTTLDIKQFGHGQSNPTYLLTAVGGGVSKRFVLRKKPPGVLLPSAHAVDREYKILAALGKTDVPVPKVYCLCMDPSVIGTVFYIMEHVEGRLFLNPSLPELDPAQRRAIYSAMCSTLAAIHKVDADAVGLGQFGRRENYCKRQVITWARQYQASTADGNPAPDPRVETLIDWLKNHVPAEDAGVERTGIVHGDFRLDNLIFHPKEPRVIAVLDWELATLGNQMGDIAYNCLPYQFSESKTKFPQPGYGFDSGRLPGIPSIGEYVSQYCQEKGLSWPASTWKFYTALALFRVTAIWTGVYRRMLQGNSSAQRNETVGEALAHLTNIAHSVIISRPLLPEVAPETNRIKPMGFEPSERVLKLRQQVLDFMDKYVYPNEETLNKQALSDQRWTVHPLEEELKQIAKAAGLWNLWIPVDSAALASDVLFGAGTQSRDEASRLVGAGLSNLDYAHICEVLGRSVWAPQLLNCSAPDTGNMEVLLRYGSPEQQRVWLKPLLEGEIRSGFAMTEPAVASSDATNIECSIVMEGDEYIINGRKWWTSGAMDPRCRLLIVMGKTNVGAPLHKQQSMILVPLQTRGVTVVRPLTVYGFDDAPHGHAEIIFQNVRVPASNLLLGEGRGFEIAQGRLGPGRLHHCMRLTGAAERGLEYLTKRALSRKAFGKTLAQNGSFASQLAELRIEVEQTRLLVHHAANQLDLHGNKVARGALAMAKVVAPRTALKVLDYAIQVHGGAGVCSDLPLAHLWAQARTLRIADGPDEVHIGTIAKLELDRARARL
ncbi:hypothetical protein R1sor_021831 [Riccia sorocarpa]|uniref:Acyl-CoA dehydrogenase family member 11 n=1 Tax=Riccia sorocarpa TaxID=122646 RepID=A0ABD3GLA4_9MARC